ncbi:MAG: glycoside hydrolase family 43 protein [Microvirga sp.]
MATIVNPILPGFNPDPAICRVGEDYYIATSTFEWFPGVQIHHSRDLVHWRLAGRPLTRAGQLDMRGDPDSCGVWAPALTFADGLFWLIYTDVKRRLGNFKDAHNYLVTAPAIEGPWTDRLYVNSSGFDPSLFHDDDGRKWFLNMVWDHRRRGTSFGGILLQEFSVAEQRLVGPVKNIFRGSPLGLVEGPHLSKRDGWYHLTVAEGGTGYNHAVTMARSRRIDGPYELHPDHHVITAKDAPDAPLQRAGHGFHVETPAGEVYHTHLCSRPLPDTRRSPLGRETGLQRMVWKDDGWLYPAGEGGPVPVLEVPGPDLPPHPFPPEPDRHDFEDERLPDAFQWLRSPDWQRLFSLRERPGHLRLFGRESIGSWFEQALVARRQTSWAYTAETVVDVHPEGYQQLAGLICYYDRARFHYLAVSADETGARVLQVISCLGDYPDGILTYALDQDLPVPDGRPVHLGVDVDQASLRFRWSADGTAWQAIGPVLDASVLSDEAGPGAHGSFRGAFVGVAAHDLSGAGLPADFDFFAYRDR